MAKKSKSPDSSRKGPTKFGPFEQLLESTRSSRVSRWSDVEGAFIEATELFDDEFSAGARSNGWYKAKARYFNDLIVALLENYTDKTMFVRKKHTSHLFASVDVDVCFSHEGALVFGAEVKALGTPPHPGNKGKARPGSQDIHKRAREVALTSIDLKAGHARPQKIATFQDWVNNTLPKYASFWSIRANNTADLHRVRSVLGGLQRFCNGVGAVVYMPRNRPTSYRVEILPELGIDQVLRDVGQRLV
jgi:hypothetical protein